MRVQASLLLEPPPGLEELRRRLDPRMAGRIPPHVTAVYDDEAPEPGLLLERLSDACALLPPIALRLGRIEAFEPPAAGLCVTVEAGQALAALRARVLRPPFSPRGPDLRPHVTILHPGSVPDASADWRSHAGTVVGWSMTVREVAVVRSDDGGPWRVQARVPLGQRR